MSSTPEERRELVALQTLRASLEALSSKVQTIVTDLETVKGSQEEYVKICERWRGVLKVDDLEGGEPEA